MSNSQSDLNYVKQAINHAEKPTGQPFIYLLWGVIVLLGYTIADVQPSWMKTYWIVAAPAGFLASIWLGKRASVRQGQIDSRLGNLYMAHFGILTLVIFIAIFTAQYQAILLLIGLGYCLAGVHLDRAMLLIGILTLLAYLAVVLNYINSNLILGAVISAGLFTAAWTQRNKSS